MRTLTVLLCSLALVCVARGAEKKAAIKSGEHSTGSTTHVQHVQPPQHAPASHGQPAGGTAHVEHAQAPQHPATVGGHAPASVPVIRPAGPENHPAAAPTGNAAGKAAASAPPAPIYHYNFPTKSGLIGRDFAKPLTPEEQSTIARQIANGQPARTQAAPGGYQNDNGVYHYNFPTKSGLIGRDFGKPLTPEEQSAVGRQIANGQPAKTQAAPGGYQYDNGVYHYNFPTKSGLIGRDFTRPLTPAEQSAFVRQIANGQPAKTQVTPGVASTQSKVNPFRAKHFNLPTKPEPAIASVKFEGTGHIQGSETWTDPKYAAFRDYHHEWHNQQWWRHHCHRIVLVAGGWYVWRASYWYPAWGYSTAHNYYPYDGPIYAYHGLAPDQVVANAQAALQALGYYDGPIDGLLSSATREALTNYQRDQGLYATSAIDEATLAALGMA